MLNFSLPDFLQILEKYNESIYPLQLLAFVLGVAAVALLARMRSRHYRQGIFILALFWIWTGFVFCLVYWVPQYPSAYAFAALMIIQGALFVVSALDVKPDSRTVPKNHLIIGLLLVLYGIVGYNLLGLCFGRIYPRIFAFGLVPCPTIVFTIGCFFLSPRRVPRYLLIIPFILALGTGIAVWNGVYEDVVVILSGILLMALLWKKPSK